MTLINDGVPPGNVAEHGKACLCKQVISVIVVIVAPFVVVVVVIRRNSVEIASNGNCAK